MVLIYIFLAILSAICFVLMMYLFCKEMKKLKNIDEENIINKLENILEEYDKLNEDLDNLKDIGKKRCGFPEYQSFLTVMSKLGSEDGKYLLMTPEGLAILGEEMGKKIYEYVVNEEKKMK